MKSIPAKIPTLFAGFSALPKEPFLSSNLLTPNLTFLAPLSEPATFVNGTIEEDTVWTVEGSPYVVQADLTVATDVTLTIEPNVVVKFDPTTSLDIYGSLLAQGQEGQEIVFTSIKDDTVAGDTNGDGDASSPAPGDWSHVWIDGDGQADLTHTILHYGGYAGYGLITAWYYGSSLSLQNTTLQFSASHGLYAMEDSILNISDSSIIDNASHGIYLTDAQLNLENSTIANNGSDGIYVYGINSTSELINNEISHNSEDGVDAAGHVTLSSNVIHGNTDDGIELRMGEELSIPTSTDNSIQDNSRGTVSSIYKGDVVLSTLSSNTLSNAIQDGNIEFGNSQDVPIPTITDNIIQNNGRDAIFVNYDTGGGLPLLSGNTFSGNGLDHGIGLGGHIGQDMSLPSDFYPDLTYVIQDLVIDMDATLTVEPGTALKFDLLSSLAVTGSLLAQGQEGQEIVFTSLKDDTVGGDTNGDGDASTPAPGDWMEFSISYRGQASLTHAILRFGGYGDHGNIILWYGTNSLSLDHATISNSASHGIFVLDDTTLDISASTIQDNHDDGINLRRSSLNLTNSTIRNNGADGVNAIWNTFSAVIEGNQITDNGDDGVEVSAPLTLSGNHILNNGDSGIVFQAFTEQITSTIRENEIAGNTHDAIIVQYAGYGSGLPILIDNQIHDNGLDRGIVLTGTIGSNMELVADYYPDMTYVIKDLTVNPDATLTLQQGVVMKFDIDANLFVEGRLQVDGSEGSEVIFTSIRDDSVGGDTNGDGDETAPSPGDWRSIYAGNASFDYAIIRFGGGNSLNDLGALRPSGEDNQFTMSNSSISDNAKNGIYASEGVTVAISDTEVQNNTNRGIYLVDSSLNLEYSHIENNGFIGISVHGEDSVTSISYCVIAGNKDYGILNSFPQVPIHATNNYWGHPSGPYHPETNPDGQGDQVSDGVVYNPWRVSPTIRHPMPIELNQPLVDLVLPMEFKDYYLEIPSNLALVVEVTPLEGSQELWLYSHFGTLPQWTVYDQLVKSKTEHGTYELLIPNTKQGTYYFSVYSRAVDVEGGNFQIVVKTVERHLSNVTPRSAGNAGQVTLKVSGIPFVEDMAIQLQGSGLPTLVSDRVTIESVKTLWAHFDLAGAPTGVYDLCAIWSGGAEEMLPGAFTITGGVGPILQSTLIAPKSVRAGRPYVLWLEYGNIGDADMPAPLFTISSPQNAPMRLSSSEPYTQESVQVLGINFDQPAGVLTPGKQYRIPIYFMSTSTQNVQFDLEQLIGDSTTIDWNEIESEVRSEDIDPQLWMAIWTNFKNSAGDTWSDYLSLLGDQATYLARYGSPTHDARMLFQTLMSHAAGTYLRQTVGWSLDSYTPARRISLAFERVAYDTLYQRFTPGPFGRGWSHNFEYTLVKTDADHRVIRGPAGTTRTFIRSQSGTWTSYPGDYGTLEELPDGSYKLHEKVGITCSFSIEGRLISIQEPYGNELSLTYIDDRMMEIHHTNGQSISLEYNDRGLIAFLTDHAGRVTQYIYDEEEPLLRQVIAPGNVITSYGYVPSTGGPSDYALESTSYPDGTELHFTFDARGRLATIWRDGGAERLDFTYDNFGSIFVKDAENNTYKVRMGAQGDILEIEDPLSYSAHFEYDQDNNLTSLIQPDGSSYSMTYTSLGDLVWFKDPLEHTTILGYTSNPSRLDWLRDARGYFTDFTFEAGNLTSIEYPDESTETFVYDLTDGDLTTYINRRGDDILFTHNDLGELTNIDYSDGSWVDTEHDEAERQWTFTDDSGTITIDYDDRGYLRYIEYPSGHWIEYVYNDAGRRESLETDDGLVLHYHYYDTGWLQAISDADEFEIAHYAYDDLGRLEEETRGNGTYTVYAYDEASRLETITHYAPDDSIQAKFEYQYNENGYPTEFATLEGTTSYEYDDRGQLIEVTYPDDRIVSYEYDAVGNRITVTDDGFATQYTTNNLNQYTQVGDVSFSFDDDGNLETRTESEQVTSFQYDIESRLVQVETTDEGLWEYTYDSLGNRATVEHNGVATYYLYDPIGYTNVIAEYDEDGQLIARYIHGLGLTARVDAQGALSYYGFDSTGSTRLMTDDTGNVISAYDYTPFGLPLHVDESVPNPFRFVGQFGVMDDGNSLNFIRARFYSPETGRFLSEDPVWLLPYETNRFTYTSNNPITYIDPLGEKWVYAGWKRMGLKDGASTTLGLTIGHFFGYTASAGIGPTIGPAMGRGWGWPAGLFSIVGIGGFGALAGYAGGISAGWSYGLTHGYFWGWEWVPDQAPQGIPKENRGHSLSTVVYPRDPNEKVSPEGIGERHAVNLEEALYYTIYFENVETADAPAQEVFVTDSLDADLDWNTLDITEIAFGDQIIAVPEATDQFYSRESILDYRPENDQTWWVDITIEVNTQTGLLSATFRTLDPETENLPEDPFAGFLPPNDNTGRGEGHISFTVLPKADRPFGTEVTNGASIIFDTNDPILTNTVSNVLGIYRMYLPIIINPVTD